MAGAQSFEENCATLLSEARLNWGRCLYDVLICIYIFIMSAFSECSFLSFIRMMRRMMEVVMMILVMAMMMIMVLVAAVVRYYAYSNIYGSGRGF